MNIQLHIEYSIFTILESCALTLFELLLLLCNTCRSAITHRAHKSSTCTDIVVITLLNRPYESDVMDNLFFDFVGTFMYLVPYFIYCTCTGPHVPVRLLHKHALRFCCVSAAYRPWPSSSCLSVQIVLYLCLRCQAEWKHCDQRDGYTQFLGGHNVGYYSARNTCYRWTTKCKCE